MKERRRGRRVLIRRRVDLSWDRGQAVGWGRDISLDGMYIQCREHPDPGADVHVTVRFRRAAAVAIPARVWRTDDEGFAIQFLGLGQIASDTIKRVVGGI